MLLDKTGLMLETVSRLSQRSKFSIGLLLIALPLVFSYVLVFSSKLDYLQQLRLKEEDRNKLIAIKMKSVDVMEEKLAAYESPDVLSLRLAAWLIEPQQQAKTLTLISHYIEVNNLLLRQLNWQEKKATDSYNKIPLEIELKGDFKDIARFTEHISKLPILITFHRSDWSGYDPSSNTLLFTAQGYGYQAKDEIER